ncbi:MAG: DUF1553 domain-containing protein [Planctomycetaceae bacterium]
MLPETGPHSKQRFSHPGLLSVLALLLMTGWMLNRELLLSANEETPAATQGEQKITDEQLEFFESHIRPVLAEQCYDCHKSGEAAEGGLVLDFREACLKGGDSGPLFNFKNPAKSLLIKVLKHELEGLEMPQGGDRLDEETIAHFETWIKMGAPDPRATPASINNTAVTSWEKTLNERKEWWSFQPVTNPEIPAATGTSSTHPIDLFIQQKLNEKGLTASSQADKRTLIRRLSFVLTGLPPTPEEIDYFLEDQSPDAYEKLVDGYLSSKRFGERWARHWMDWVRYTDTHGSEGDPGIPFAFRYRDYLIRALNNDVPYDQLVREHIAGDLLPEPRVDKEQGINESAIGTAHWRMVFHGFSPTDALDEKVRFTDDQINVYSKAFLGLTVSCARCHNHKFDAISQTDFYALFGILDSTRPATNDINLPEVQHLHQDELQALKTKIKSELIQGWQNSVEQISPQLTAPDQALADRINQSQDRRELLNIWKQLSSTANQEEFKAAWDKIVVGWKSEQNHIKRHQKREYGQHWTFDNQEDYLPWHRDGNGLTERVSSTGEFSLAPSGDKILTGIYPAGVYSHSLSSKHRAVLSSPRIHLDKKYDLWFRTIGDQNAMTRYAVQHYPRSGTIYPIRRINNGSEWVWTKHKLDYWEGDDIHLEATTSEDQPILVTGNQRSWIGLREVVLFEQGSEPPPAYDLEYLTPLMTSLGDQPVDSLKPIRAALINTTRNALAHWESGNLTDAEALLLNQLVSAELLPNHALSTELQELISDYRRLEGEVPVPTRVPGLLESDVVDQPLMVRGNHKQLNQDVPRRFLEAINETAYDSNDSGRLELARDTVREDNPLTKRVIVNRLWHYLMGAGLVRTPDNFGKLGEEPTHPELLDYLAHRFGTDGWSIKSMIRLIVTSETFKRSAAESDLTAREDPDNRYWSHASRRRMEAEAIRDSILAISGQLDLTMYGPGNEFDKKQKRRSVYELIQRNKLDPFLTTFDAPTPFATQGRRDVTNVPGQSLTMLNDPFIHQSAQKWIKLLEADYPDLDAESQIKIMFEQALGREPSKVELAQSLKLVNTLSEDYGQLDLQYAELENEVQRTEQAIEKLIEPARRKLLADKIDPVNLGPIPEPIAYWDFDEDLLDKFGQLHGELNGSARLEEGALILDGKGYVSTVPIPETIHEKTLEAWVILDNLEQQGGGVMTLQGTDGILFDSIVIGEIKPRQWLAGSNNFARTLDFQGTDDTDVLTEAVHLAITYDQAGNITCYRNGKLYGHSIRKAPLQAFQRNESNLLFGLRHFPGVGNRLLKGRILEARLYDRALTAAEVATTSKSMGVYVSPGEIRAELTPEEVQKLMGHESTLSELKLKLESLGERPGADQAWIELGHAIFNLKNFIYFE